MAYIYKITNILNGKSYMGKTLKSIEERFQEHIRDSQKSRCEKRPLYDAMNKYGIENFQIEQIEECSDNIVNEREVYWIEWYGSFKYGYNATLGGDGKHYLDYDLICEVYNQTQNMKETAQICGCHPDSVSNILMERKIQKTTTQEIIRKRDSKMINQYDLADSYLRTFPSLMDAARYLKEMNLANGVEQGIASHIRDVALGRRKSAYKFHWKFS